MTAIIIVTGNVGRVDTRSMPNGERVCNFSVASNRKIKGEDRTTWVGCVAFGKLAEMLEQHLTKGQKVYAHGDMENREWEKGGVKHYRTECRVQTFDFLGSKKDNQQGGNNTGGGGSSEPSNPNDFGPPPSDDFDDDIPF